MIRLGNMSTTINTRFFSSQESRDDERGLILSLMLM